jgi:hypothetical protein
VELVELLEMVALEEPVEQTLLVEPVQPVVLVVHPELPRLVE